MLLSWSSDGPLCLLNKMSRFKCLDKKKDQVDETQKHSEWPCVFCVGWYARVCSGLCNEGPCFALGHTFTWELPHRSLLCASAAARFLMNRQNNDVQKTKHAKERTFNPLSNSVTYYKSPEFLGDFVVIFHSFHVQ